MNRRVVLTSLWLLWLAGSVRAATVCWITVEGAIGPAAASYVDRAIREATERNAQCLVIQLDTPGGLLDSTKSIVQAMLASPVPVVVYVAPRGAMAGSAGCFITLASDIAAMAPATAIGAAHPVQISSGGEVQKQDEVMRQKLENFYSSYIASIAARHNRNAEWARSAVKDSASIPAEKALELKVIEIIAADRQDLLKQLDGRQVAGRTLATADASVVEIEQTFREKLLQMLSHPELMVILMLIATWGIIGELSNPGAILPGVAGVIALVLMLYMMAVLPVNVAGLALIGLAIAMFIIDVFAPTHGVLTVGGVIAFFLGALMMFDRTEPMLRVSLALLIPATVLTGLFFAFVVGAGLRAQFLPRKAGVETMLGRVVPALSPIDPSGGKVFVEGEYWNAVSDQAIPKDTPVEIVAVQGLTLKVRARQS